MLLLLAASKVPRWSLSTGGESLPYRLEERQMQGYAPVGTFFCF